MTGPEHYREAEAALGTLYALEAGSPAEAARLAEAQVHATLALAAATALSRYTPEDKFPEADKRAWYVAASEGPADKQRQIEARKAGAAEFAEAQS